MNKNPKVEYLASDYAGEFQAELQLDITKMNLKDETIDLVICYHVLEHIEEDEKAMRELYRILKHEGKAIIQTPI